MREVEGTRQLQMRAGVQPAEPNCIHPTWQASTVQKRVCAGPNAGGGNAGKGVKFSWPSALGPTPGGCPRSKGVRGPG